MATMLKEQAVTAADIVCNPVTTEVGAVIEGLDLTQPLAPDVVAKIRSLLANHGVLFFRKQDLDDDQLSAFVTHFGQPVPEPFVSAKRPDAPAVGQSDTVNVRHATACWHHDTTFIPEPPMLTALRAVRVPKFGGDTCWASMYAAYDALSEPIRNLIDGLSSVHSMEPVLKRMGREMGANYQSNESLYGRSQTHPMVIVHPENGRKALYYKEGWPSHVVGLNQYESEHLVALLREHVKSPNFNMRWHWENNDLALWDNRAVQHFAAPDYSTERVIQRVVTAGEPLHGPQHL